MRRKGKWALPLAAALLITLAGCGDAPLPLMPSEPSGGETPGDAAPVQTEDFALRSAAQLLDPAENSCYSPVSLYLALSMAGTGAAGETQGQIYDVLGAADTQQQIASCAALMETLACDGEETALYFANSVWTRAGLPMEQSYLDGLKTGFGAEHFSVDFSKQDTNEKMTRWVSRQTRGLLEPEFSHGGDTMEVLLNTIYFRDSWSEPFSASATEEGTFTLADGETRQAPFMHLTREQQASFCGDYAVASLALAGGGEMIFAVPWEGQTLAGVMEQYDLPQLLSPAREDTYLVEWSVPKFTAGGEQDLIPMLRALGVTDAFDPYRADFSAACAEDAYISAVRQGTYLSVDEKGVEAAAFTEIAKDESAALPSTDMVLQMCLDQPFLYALRGADGTLLFVGVCADPGET